ncbi:hypothetical protein DPX16_0650 [Anabarilius grahami]|uniref:Uncharacterized protein n=1 Tax=Anabarilius grahami TaxID=495550 RepID=A0A3N0YF99_ANAGA|nr:hypothetical protein DPX16_0650 [Anabarilius grahami]
MTLNPLNSSVYHLITQKMSCQFTGQHRYSKYADKGHIDPRRITNNVKGHWGDTMVNHGWGMGKLRGWSVGEGKVVGGTQGSQRIGFQETQAEQETKVEQTEQMTRVVQAEQEGLKTTLAMLETTMVEQMTTTAVQRGLKIPTAEQTTTTVV